MRIPSLLPGLAALATLAVASPGRAGDYLDDDTIPVCHRPVVRVFAPPCGPKPCKVPVAFRFSFAPGGIAFGVDLPPVRFGAAVPLMPRVRPAAPATPVAPAVPARPAPLPPPVEEPAPRAAPAPAPAAPAPAENTFPYDGGPARPVPVPQTEEGPTLSNPPPAPRDDLPVALSSSRGKWVFPAYGEQPRRDSRRDSTIIRRVPASR